MPRKKDQHNKFSYARSPKPSVTKRQTPHVVKSQQFSSENSKFKRMGMTSSKALIDGAGKIENGPNNRLVSRFPIERRLFRFSISSVDLRQEIVDNRNILETHN